MDGLQCVGRNLPRHELWVEVCANTAESCAAFTVRELKGCGVCVVKTEAGGPRRPVQWHPQSLTETNLVPFKISKPLA